MKIARFNYFLISIGLLLLVIGICCYPFLPDRMGFHWNGTNPEPDTYCHKFWGTFLLPIIYLAVLMPYLVIIGLAISHIGGKKVECFHSIFSVAFSLVFLVLDVVVILWNLGVNINVNFWAMASVIVFVIVSVIALFTLIRQRGSFEHRSPFDS